jgi:hypothetical protein
MRARTIVRAAVVLASTAGGLLVGTAGKTEAALAAAAPKPSLVRPLGETARLEPAANKLAAHTNGATTGGRNTIVIGKGMGGVYLDMRPQQVLTILGTPTRTVHPRPYYAPQLEYIYPHYLVIFQGRDAVTSISTTSPTQRTLSGIGVGSNHAAVESRIPHIHCDPNPRLRCYVGGVRPGEVVTEFDFAGNCRVSEIFVSLVSD